MKYYYCAYQYVVGDKTLTGYGLQSSLDQFQIKAFIKNMYAQQPNAASVILTFWKEITAEQWNDLSQCGITP